MTAPHARSPFSAALLSAALLSTALLSAALLNTAQAAPPAPVEHHLRFPAPHTHYVEVEARIPSDTKGPLTVGMAAWAPGSYLIRDFARHVEGLSARDTQDRPLAVRKTHKHRWQIERPARGPAILSYRLYAREMSVRTNWIEADFALLNGPATFLRPLDGRERPHEVTVTRPAHWPTVVTGLPPHPDGGADRWRAPDYEALVDAPLLLGAPQLHTFTVDGRPHRIATLGAGDTWDAERTVDDVRRLIETQRDFWGALPYADYTIINLLTEASGGLEHHNSTVLMGSRFRQRQRADYLDWLRLVNHEVFHVWNVKRLRPIELVHIDYETENYTPSLWIAEGFTSYYDALLLHRAGHSSPAELLATLAGKIRTVQTSPGRLVRSLEAASHDAWIRHYRPDENSNNATISYYTKGALVAFLLDAEIRRHTHGERSLDHVMRGLYARFSGPRGYRPEDLFALASDVAGRDLRPFLHAATRTTQELDYAPALQHLGLRFRPAPKPTTDPPPDPKPGWLGLSVQTHSGRIVVDEVTSGTPAHLAGINTGDELIAIGDDRLPASGFESVLRNYAPGTQTTALIARRGRLHRLPITFGERPAETWTLEVDPAATPEQKRQAAAWLAGRAPADPAPPPGPPSPTPRDGPSDPKTESPPATPTQGDQK